MIFTPITDEQRELVVAALFSAAQRVRDQLIRGVSEPDRPPLEAAAERYQQLAQWAAVAPLGTLTPTIIGEYRAALS
jgi:hypothetical protein